MEFALIAMAVRCLRTLSSRLSARQSSTSGLRCSFQEDYDQWRGSDEPFERGDRTDVADSVNH